MQVMFNVTNPLAREQTMTKIEDRAKVIAIKELLEQDEETPFSRTRKRTCSHGSNIL